MTPTGDQAIALNDRVAMCRIRDSDTHPKDGDGEAAPLVSSAVAKPIAQGLEP